MRAWWNRFRTLLTGREAIDGGLAEELRSHLEMEAENFRERGLPDHDARAAARRRFGNATLVAERARDAWVFSALENLLRDVRFAWRGIRRTPTLSLVLILTFALGVGLNAAIFSVVHAVLLKPLPYPASERLLLLGEANAKEDFSVSWGNFQYWRDGNRSFEEMAAFQFAGQTLTGRGDASTVRGMTVTPGFFPLLGMRPLMGRLLVPDDDRSNARDVVVVAHAFWTGRLAGDPHAVGTTLTLNGKAFQIVGVAAPQWAPWRADYYLPLGRHEAAITNRAQHQSIRALARLKPGVTLAAAGADLDAIMRHLAEIDPGPESDHHSYATFFTDDVVGGLRGAMTVLMGAAVLILLIACANIASLLLARQSARSSELALRQAIGAGQGRLVRQLFTESLLIAAAGGAAGLLFAYGGLRLLVAAAPRSIPRLADTRLDAQVLLFACAVTIAAGFLAGLAPVLLAGRIDLAHALKEGSRVAGAGHPRQTLRNFLTIGEVALTLVLAFGSGLLLRSLAAAQSADPGFRSGHLLTLTLDLPSNAYRTPADAGRFFTTLTADLRALPGVSDARAVHCPPPAGDCGDWFYSIPGRPLPARDQVPISLFNSADPGYFHMMGIALREGREFADTDRAGSAPVAVINETLARTGWPHEPAVGQRIKVGGPYQEGDVLTIVGVAGDVRQSGLDTTPDPEIFLPAAQQLDRSMAILVRTAGDPGKLLRAVRGRVAALDRNLPIQRPGSMEQALAAGLERRRFSAFLLALFGGLAMVLAAIGIYGMLNYWVTSREPEIAVRLALGATPARILGWTGAHAVRLAAAGIALGSAGAWAAARLLRDLVFGIPAQHPATLAGAALAVLTLAVGAAAVPSWRAARVDAAARLHQG